MVDLFEDKKNEKAFNPYFSKNSTLKIHRSALLQLRSLSQARNINELPNLPSNRYHSNRGVL